MKNLCHCRNYGLEFVAGFLCLFFCFLFNMFCKYTISGMNVAKFKEDYASVQIKSAVRV